MFQPRKAAKFCRKISRGYDKIRAGPIGSVAGPATRSLMGGPGYLTGREEAQRVGLRETLDHGTSWHAIRSGTCISSADELPRDLL